MRAQAMLGARPYRLWIIVLPPLVLGVALAVLATAGLLALPLLPLWCACLLLALAEGALLARLLRGWRATESRARQLQAVYDVISKAGASLELQEVLDSITRLTVEVTGVRGCAIKLRDPSADHLTIRSVEGIGGAETIPSLEAEDSLVCVPLRHDGRELGALCVYGEEGRPVTPATLAFLSSLGNLASLSIEHAEVYQTLKRVDEAKGWFLRKAAHELASPLAAVQSIAGNLLGGYLGPLAESQRESVERIRARAAGLAEVAADLLVLAKGRALAVDGPPGTVNLCQSLAEALSFYQASAREHGVELAVTGPQAPCTVAGTAEAIRSVISNLVSNAIKYSGPGQTVDVQLTRADQGTELVVSDRGIGIPASEQQRLFEEFFRAANARAHTESGTGLGLAIVRSVLDAIGGRVTIDSQEGRGTTVRVFFPQGPSA
ncbi:MAG TPA: ATP-binding protein [Spirochaetia bacterium]|nr:ATP-binding protein [Spirochaetia bacterium]